MGEPAGGAGETSLRTAQVARATGYSVQQVRDLEVLGVIPPAARSAGGYRSYTPLHVRALAAYRGIAGAVGPVEARRLLREAWSGTRADAAAVIGGVHVRLAREREEVLAAQAAVRAVRAEVRTAGAVVREADAMTVTQLAEALGVRASTLRFWEDEGLVHPERVTSLRARRYGTAAIGEARIVAALRAGGYGVPAVREVMGSLRTFEGLEEAERVLRRRLDRIAARSVALLTAGADLAAVIATLATPGE
ncbi:MerR family transcriptional regulator [Streptomyces sp. NPDC049881]|uniref:MerR family transcriptional regulator n=1 Tax=unclassified Streptomyces TaxID=2593676 RepID=UPI00342F87C6